MSLGGEIVLRKLHLVRSDEKSRFFQKCHCARKEETKIIQMSQIRASHDKNSPFSMEMDFYKTFWFSISTAKIRI
tara:strand:+ start:93 stop:317 length:225 start_codon:yes stop_codon:yes gene_type:complete